MDYIKLLEDIHEINQACIPSTKLETLTNQIFEVSFSNEPTNHFFGMHMLKFAKQINDYTREHMPHIDPVQRHYKFGQSDYVHENDFMRGIIQNFLFFKDRAAQKFEKLNSFSWVVNQRNVGMQDIECNNLKDFMRLIDACYEWAKDELLPSGEDSLEDACKWYEENEPC